MFNWFNADAAKNLGHLLAEHIVSNLPQEMAMDNDRFLIKKQEVLQYLTMKIYQFNLMQSMNFYKKVQFAKSFKLHLAGSGFQERAISNMLGFVMSKLNKNS